MTSFTKTGAEIWRDFNTDGEPSSGAHNVVKYDMRDWMAAVETGFSDPVTTFNTVTPRDFGGAGDGSTNDAVALQAAIDSTATPLVVNLEGKTWRVDSQITLRSGLRLCNGMLDFTNGALGATLLSAQGTLGSPVSFTSANRGAASFVVSSAAGIAAGTLMYIESATNFASGGTKNGEFVEVTSIASTTVTPTRHLLDYYNSSPQFYLPSLLTGIELRDLNLIGAGTGKDQIALSAYLCRNLSAINVQVDLFATTPLKLVRCLDSAVDRCSVRHSDGSSGFGVALSNGCLRCRVTTCSFSDCVRGVAIGGTLGVDRHIAVSGCTITNCTDAGLAALPNTQFVTFIGNTVGAANTAAMQDGILMQGANSAVSGNIVEGFSRYGIYLRPQIANANFTDNQVSCQGNQVSGPLASGVYGILLQNEQTPAALRFAIGGNNVHVADVTGSRGIFVEVVSGGSTISAGAITGNTVYSRIEALTLKTATNKVMSRIAVNGNALESLDASPMVSGASPPVASATAGWVNNTYVNEASALPNGATIDTVGMYSDAAVTLTMKIVKRNSSTNVDVVVSQSFSHPGGGWADLTLSSPYAVPASGTYYVGAFFNTDASIKYNASITRLFVASNITGNGQTVAEATSVAPSFRATIQGAGATDCVLISAGSTPNFLERVVLVGNSIFGGRYGINNSNGSRIAANSNLLQGFGTAAGTGTFASSADNVST